MNDYRNPGIYFCPNNNIWSSLSNKPNSWGAFLLFVFIWGSSKSYGSQISLSYQIICIRSLTDGIFGGWHQIHTNEVS